MLHITLLANALPKFVVVEDRIELSAQGNLRVRGKMLSHNRLHISRHVNRGPSHDLPSSFPLKVRLCPGKVEVASNDGCSVHFRRTVQLGDVGSSDQIHILIHLLHLTHQ